MIYNKIKKTAKTKNVKLRDLAEKIGMSETGLHKMFLNETMQVKTLEAIAEVLKVPVTYFIDDQAQEIKGAPDQSPPCSEINCAGCIEKLERIQELKEMIFELKEKNLILKKELSAFGRTA